MDIEDIYLLFTMFACTAFGYLLWLIAKAEGESEMYFAIAVNIPQYVLIVIVFMKKQEEMRKCDAVQVIFAGIMIVSVANYLLYGYHNSGMLRSVYGGMRNLLSADIERTDDWDTSGGIQRADVEALKWIKDNTDNKALIVSDRAVMLEDAAYYCYGIYSERQQYLEGTDMLFNRDDACQNEIDRRIDLISSIYHNDAGAVKQAKREGINYIVQTKEITPYFKYNTEELKLVISTDSMNVFQIR